MTAIVLMSGFTLAMPATAQAATVRLDSGAEFSLQDTFAHAQAIPDVYDAQAVYGKLEGANDLDIYTFTPSKDGSQIFDLLVRPQENSGDAQPLLIFYDPTTNTEARPLGLPVPNDTYHTTIVQQLNDQERSYNEPGLFAQYTVVAEQTIKLNKDKVYYFVAYDPSHKVKHYAIKMGDGKVWTAGTVFRHFGTWLRLKSDMYAQTSPFHFTILTFSLLLFFLGFLVLGGFWIIQETFALLANRSKAAAFLLIKMQSFSRYSIWGALWFMALGGYIYFAKVGWFGIPFVMGLVFIPIVLTQLYSTIFLSRELVALEVSKREAVIELPLRRKLLINFSIALLSIGAFITMLSMYFSSK